MDFIILVTDGLSGLALDASKLYSSHIQDQVPFRNLGCSRFCRLQKSLQRVTLKRGFLIVRTTFTQFGVWKPQRVEMFIEVPVSK